MSNCKKCNGNGTHTRCLYSRSNGLFGKLSYHGCDDTGASTMGCRCDYVYCSCDFGKKKMRDDLKNKSEQDKRMRKNKRKGGLWDIMTNLGDYI